MAFYPDTLRSGCSFDHKGDGIEQRLEGGTRAGGFQTTLFTSASPLARD